VSTLPHGHLEYRLLQLPHRGKGGAVRAGVAAARGDPIVFLDSDLSIPVDIIDQFIRALNDGADIAIASRYVTGSIVRRPWWRRVMGTAYRWCVHLLVPVDVKDTQCGGKAYTAEAAKDLFARSRLDGFSFDAEILFLARRAGYRVREVPFALIQDRITSINFVYQAPRMLRDLFLIRANAILGRYGRGS
jgi:dolichyl-phosphate beta-glucosyltransferase